MKGLHPKGVELGLQSAREAKAMYQQMEKLLDEGWSGTYAELAREIGLKLKGVQGIVQYLKAYALQHPDWPVERVFESPTRLHAVGE